MNAVFEAVQTDMVNFVGQYVKLQRKGTNYVGSCPFHNEKTPSFVVSPSKGIYKCFGCGKAGNPVNFLMDYSQVEFTEAIEKIADKYNIKTIMFFCFRRFR